eukprot:c12388_g1_i2.p1 GENE.c12388_g1_i2~~c12388_g1_i2.p1  ORF type:complete len:100 (+),score=17.15 c12388_g1_i2:104-403(+)
MLNWNQNAIILGSLGITMMSLGSAPAQWALGLTMLLIGIGVLVYAQYKYYTRWLDLIGKSHGLSFLDARGPLALTVAFVSTIFIALIYRGAHSHVLEQH